MSQRRRTIFGSIFWAPWSAVAWVLSISWLSFLTLICLPLMPFVPFERFQLLFPHPAMGWTLWISFTRLKVIHDPGFDKKRMSVFMQNHVSMLDACIATGAIRLPLCGLENSAHLKVPGYGWLLRFANAIPIEQGNRRSYAAAAEAFHERASRGISILTFPEAHRTLDGKVRKLKRGVFIMARDAGLPIVPMAVRGAFWLLPKGTVTMRPGTVEVYFAPQIETKGLSDAQIGELAERVHQILSAFVERGEMLGHLATEPLGSGPAKPKSDDEQATG